MGNVVLVTGASGLIGRTLARRLAGKGYAVRAASRTPRHLAEGPWRAVAMPRPGAGPETWRAFLEGVDHVVHCAAIAGSGAKIPDKAYTDANVGLTAGLAVAAAAAIGGSFVHLSSIRIYGASSTDVVTESSPPVPSDAYGRSKLESERAVRDAFPEGGRFTILRPAPVYGQEAGGLCGALAKLASLPTPLPLANLPARYSLLDLERCVDAIEHALFGTDANGRTFNLCDRDSLTIGEFVAAVRRGRGRNPALFPVPSAIFSTVLHAVGRDLVWQRLSSRLVADCRALEATGWTPVDDTATRLESLFAQSS